MPDIDLKAATPDTSLPTTGFLFGADSQASASPSVYSTQTVATTLLGSTSLTGATITTSQPVLDLAQTWNASGVTFTGLRFNAATGSSAGSAAASLLMDLQLEGASRFNVNKTGAVNALADGSAAAPSLRLGATEVHGFYRTGSSSIGLSIAGALTFQFASIPQGVGFRLLGNDLGIGFGATSDLILTRRAAANLRLGAADAAAPVAQTLSVQSVVAGTSDTAGANFTITGSQGTGTGAGGSIIFQVAPAGLSSGTAQNALVEAFRIQPGARIRVANAGIAGVAGSGFYSLDNTAIGFGQDAGSGVWGGITSSGFVVSNALYYGFGSSGTALPDLFLTRRGAANLRLGAADAASPVAQTLSVQSVVAGTSNTAGANLTITGSQGTGTGAGGSIIFQVAPAGSSGSAQNALTTALTINGSGQLVFPNSGTPSPLIQFQYAGYGIGSNNNGETVVLINNVSRTNLGSGGVRVSPLGGYAWGTTDSNSASDLILARDAANTLALRNGNNGQTFRIYGRFTDITNDFERFFINAPTTSGAAVQLGTQKGATTGAARALEFQTDGTSRWSIGATTGHLLAGADNTYDIGASGASRPRNVYVAGDVTAAGAVVAGASQKFQISGRINYSSPVAGVAEMRTPALGAGTVYLGQNTVANLPSASSYDGALAFVSDATATTARSTVAGGGSNKVMVMSDGTNWLIVA